MEITDLRNNTIMVSGKIISAQKWLTGGTGIVMITDTGYRLTLTTGDIITLDNAIDGIEP
jgi:hypothetical protein